MVSPSPIPCALFLVSALGLAGAAHVAWLRSPWSTPFALPLDRGLTIRHRPLFGANKTWRGLMIMPPAAALSFALFGLGRHEMPKWLATGIWDLPVERLAAVGFVAGLAFMLAELPNSFLKRRLGVAPGDAPASPGLRLFCFVLDRSDSTLGVLLALSLLLPVHPLTWVWALLFGAGLHWLFSFWLYRLRLKKRPS